jgi:anti-sigma-K factor RskA
MSDSSAHEPPPHDVAAAEYALGLLDGPEQTQAQQRRLSDPAFARRVEAWELRLAGLNDAIAPVPPPPDVWASLSERLQRETEDGAAQRTVVRLKRSLALWRGATAAAAGLAACLTVALAWPRAPAPAAPMLMARLSAPGHGPAVFVALYDPMRKAIVLTPAEVEAAAGRSPELWLIPTGGKPIALGVADFASPVQLVSTRDAQGLAAGALAVSLEPRGGSPTGQPTGPVIATGQLSRL